MDELLKSGYSCRHSKNSILVNKIFKNGHRTIPIMYITYIGRVIWMKYIDWHMLLFLGVSMVHDYWIYWGLPRVYYIKGVK